MIDHTHRIIFTHIPKTGGTSIEKAISNRDWWEDDLRKEKHITTNQAKKIYKKYWKKYFKFSVVRNPWDLMVSWYKWRNLNCDYKKYLLEYNILTPLVPAVSAADYILNDNNELQVDFVCKFENLHHDFQSMCKKSGIKNITLPHINKTNHKHYTEYYDDETREIVEQKYARDIEYFGYEFGE